MEFIDYLITDNKIKETGIKYNKTPRDIKVLLLLQLNKNPLTSIDFYNKLLIERTNLKLILDKLIKAKYIDCDRSKIPFKYSITENGQKITKSFYKALKRAK